MRKANYHELVGRKFNRVTVLKLEGSRSGRATFLCRCDCGKEFYPLASNVKKGDTTSCGCYFKEIRGKCHIKHGHCIGVKESPLYGVWNMMQSRCLNPKNPRYKDYGGRGISITEKWIGENGFQNFLNDMGIPESGMSIDRIDNNQGYCKENCRWATRKEQGNNKRTNRFFVLEGEKLTVAIAAERLGIRASVLIGRLNRNWSYEKILSQPVLVRKNTRIL